MKKGDIVTLKDQKSLLGAYFTIGSDERALSVFKEGKEFPAELTVMKMGSISVCCTIYTVAYFKEIGKVAFDPDEFNVVLEAGEPDVEKLMQESKELERVAIGF